METETLDKLYLEWSQFTKAKTKRELQLEAALRKIAVYSSDSAYVMQIINSLKI